jgi:hypothetical protein
LDAGGSAAAAFLRQFADAVAMESPALGAPMCKIPVVAFLLATDASQALVSKVFRYESSSAE